MSEMHEPGGRPLADSTSLDELDDLFGLSTRAWNTCRRYGIETLGRMRQIGFSMNGFRGLQGCGRGTIMELEDLLAKTGGTMGVDEVRPASGLDTGTGAAEQGLREDAGNPARDLDLAEIASTLGLSVRAFNVLQAAKLTTLSAIRDFHRTQGGFLKLRNCGTTTQYELEVLLEKAAAKGLDQGTPGSVPSTPVDMSDLERFFEVLLAGLSIRTRNVLAGMVGQLSAASTLAYFKRHGSRWWGQPGVGVVASRELRVFRRRLLEAADGNSGLASNEEGADARTGIARWYYRHRIPVELRSMLFDEHGRMTLLRFLEHFFELNGNDSKMRVRSAYLKLGAAPNGREELAQRIGLTRERVRQLLVHMDREFLATIAFIADLPEVADRYPELCVDGPMLVVDLELTGRLNTAEGTHWSPLFILYVAMALNRGRHQRVHWTELFDRDATSKQLDHNAPIIMDRGLVGYIGPATRQVTEHMAQRRFVPERIDLSPVFQQLDDDQRSQAMQVLVALMALRFPLITVTNGFATFPATTRKRQVEMLEDVLRSLNEPSHVSRVVEEWNKLFPEEPINERGVRSVAVREKDRFFSIGRTSTYGLRRWEAERAAVRGGTIRDIVVSILSDSSEPMHVDDLTVLIKRYRPDTTAPSVRLNLQLDQEKRFVFFPGGYIGLTNTVYARVPDPRPRIPGSLLRRSVLRAYIGRPLDELVFRIQHHSGASLERVRTMVEGKVADGTLLLNDDQVILAVRQPQSGSID